MSIVLSSFLMTTRPFLILGQFRIANFPHDKIFPPRVSCRVVFGATAIFETERCDFPSNETKARIPVKEQTKYMLGSRYQDENLTFELIHEYEESTVIVGRYDLPICLMYPHNVPLEIEMRLYDTQHGCEDVLMTCWCGISTNSSFTVSVDMDKNPLKMTFRDKTVIERRTEVNSNDVYQRKQTTTNLLQRIPKEYLKLFQSPDVLSAYVSSYRNQQYEDQTDDTKPQVQFAAGVQSRGGRQLQEYDANPYFSHYNL